MIRFWYQLLPAYIFTKPVFFGTYFLALLVHFADSINNTSGNVILRIVIVTTLHAGVYGALFLFKQILLDRVKPGLVPWLTLATLAFVGLFRGFFFENWLFAWDISGSKEISLRMQTSLFNIVSTFSLGIVATANSRMHQIKSAQLLNELENLEKIKVNALARIKSIDNEAVEGIKSQLDEFVKKMQGRSISEILLILRNMIDTVVQPLSRQLEVEPINLYSPAFRDEKIRVNWIQAFKSGLNPGTISYGLVPILMIVVSLPTVIENSPTALAFFSITLAYCVGFLIGKLFSSIFVNYKVNFGAYLGVTLVTGFAMGVCTLRMTQNYDSPYGFLILSTISYPIAASLVSMVKNADAQLAIATLDLAQATQKLEWNVARIREAQHQNQRNLARALHGSVQAKLAAAYLELEKIDLEQVINPQRVDQIVAEIKESIATINSRQRQPEDLSESIDKTIENWASVAEITSQISGQDLDLINRDALSVVALIDVIPELVFNAIKHGKATAIAVLIKFSDERVVQLSVKDNGIYELNHLGAGLGTKILDESAISWNRERVAGQTITTAEFAYSLEKSLPS
jgi:signal transduction histidine kinase